MTTRAASKGGRGKCTVCASPDRDAIDRALIGGASAATVSGRFGVSESSVKRHRRSHTPIEVVSAHADEPEISQPAAAIDIPSEMLAQFRRSGQALEAARRGGGHLSINAALREHRQTLEAISRWNTEQAKIAAMNRTDQVVNVLQTGQWLLARTAVMKALNPYVEARLAVADALVKLENTPRNYKEESNA